MDLFIWESHSFSAQVDGGSDWVCLNKEFVSYVVAAEEDDLLSGLHDYFRYALLPAEAFFHMVLRNSRYEMC